MQKVSDNVLVDRVNLLDDQHAFSELMRRHQSKIRYMLRQITGWNDALADDLTQETFLSAYKGLKNFRKEAKFSSWIYLIAVNSYRQFLRKKREELVEDEVLEQGLHYEPEAAEQLHYDLARAMIKLSFNQRATLHLFLHRQFTHPEIAEILQMPLGSVKTHINRGRDILQNQLSAWQPNKVRAQQ